MDNLIWSVIFFVFVVWKSAKRKFLAVIITLAVFFMGFLSLATVFVVIYGLWDQ